MKNYQIIMNNVEKVTQYANLYRGIRTIHMNSIFAQKKLKELAKKVPKNFDVESIKKFEKETGLILKYYVFNDKYEFFEYTHLGIFPNNERLMRDYGIGKYPYEELMREYLENFDILVIDKVTNLKRN